MIVVHDGEYHETASICLNENGYVLDSMTWDDAYPRMEIGYHHNGMAMSLDVRGLPMDVPLTVFDELLTHLIKTQIRGQKKVTVSKDTIAYIMDLKIKKVKK